MCTMEEVAEIGARPNSIPISCQLQLNMDGLLERIWEMMALVGGGGGGTARHSTAVGTKGLVNGTGGNMRY
jgi:hypothetical protein